MRRGDLRRYITVRRDEIEAIERCEIQGVREGAIGERRAHAGEWLSS